MTDEPSETADPEEGDALYEDLSEVVKAARRGFLRDVELLVRALPRGGLLVPLATEVRSAQAPDGTDDDESVTIRPHLLPDRDGTSFVPLFTDADALVTVGEYLQWSTDDSNELQYCTLPALVAVELALSLLADGTVVGAVINPSDEHELVLQRHELAALSQQQALPLVGYVQEIPVADDEEVLVAELAAPPSPELIAAIEACLAHLPHVDGYALEQTFNKERDLEPHPTLTLRVKDPEAIDANKLNELLAEKLEGKLPDPGYIDVLFDTAGAKTD